MPHIIERDWITSSGLRAVVLAHKHRCGYVGVPPGHPLYACDRVDFDVHGGITYAANVKAYPVPSDLWWLGYDCAHCGDAPIPENMSAEERDLDRRCYAWEGVRVVRSLEYCITECERLATQIAEAANSTPTDDKASNV